MAVGNDAMMQIMTEAILPALQRLVFDRTVLLRKQLILVIGEWMSHDGEDAESGRKYFFQQCEPDLFLLLILGMSDEAPEVQEAAMRNISAVGNAWVKRHPAGSQMDIVDYDDMDYNGDKQGSKMMARELLPLLLPKVR